MPEKGYSGGRRSNKARTGELVRHSVEATLNALLDEEADRLANARRLDTRAGDYKQNLVTKVGEVMLEVPEAEDSDL